MAKELRISEAKPCPFCGEHTTKLIYQGGYRVQCQICTTVGPDGVNDESALIQWNKRESPVKQSIWEGTRFAR